MATFKTNKTYYLRSICDYNCVCIYTVIKRTAKTITVQQIGESGEKVGAPETFRVKTDTFNGSEYVRPWGSYSMCPTLSADRPYVA